MIIACIDMDFEEGRYQHYFDEESRIKALKKLKKQVEKAEVWGKEFDLKDSFCEELLENYVDIKERTEKLELDIFKENDYYYRMYKDKERSVWSIDFVDEKEDFYGFIYVPYTKKEKMILVHPFTYQIIQKRN